jgi:hypothetical protein
MAHPRSLIVAYDKNPSFVPSEFRYFAVKSRLQHEQAAEKGW